MEISDVRKKLQSTIERAKRRAADRRARNDAAAGAFETFLEVRAVPLFRQVANALRAEGYHFTVFTPSGSVRLMSDRHGEDYVELLFDGAGEPPQVVGHSSRSRGRNVTESEQPLGEPAAITEEQLLSFLLKELEPLVER